MTFNCPFYQWTFEAQKVACVCMNVQQYAKENLDTLSIKMLSEYMHDKAPPALVHSKFNGPVEEQSVSVALELESEEYKSKLK